MEKYRVNNYEYGTLMESIVGNKIDQAKVYISKLMPLINKMQGPKITKQILDQTMFLNASDCKITPTKIVETQNYVTLLPYQNEPVILNNKVKTVAIDEDTIIECIPKDTNIMIEVLYEDTRNMHIIGKE